MPKIDVFWPNSKFFGPYFQKIWVYKQLLRPRGLFCDILSKGSHLSFCSCNNCIALDKFGLSFCFVAIVRYEFLCWFDLSYCIVATVRCEFLCWFGLSFCFVATVRCKFLCWFDLELIRKCCLCLSLEEEVASGTARLPWPMTSWVKFKQSQRK